MTNTKLSDWWLTLPCCSATLLLSTNINIVVKWSECNVSIIKYKLIAHTTLVSFTLLLSHVLCFTAQKKHSPDCRFVVEWLISCWVVDWQNSCIHALSNWNCCMNSLTRGATPSYRQSTSPVAIDQESRYSGIVLIVVKANKYSLFSPEDVMYYFRSTSWLGITRWKYHLSHMLDFSVQTHLSHIKRNNILSQRIHWLWDLMVWR